MGWRIPSSLGRGKLFLVLAADTSTYFPDPQSLYLKVYPGGPSAQRVRKILGFLHVKLQ